MSEPLVLTVQPENIPPLLKNTDRWGLWCRGKDKPGGRYGKAPVDPETGLNTNAHNPDVWRSLDEALRIYKVGQIRTTKVAGISFDLPTEPEPICYRQDGTPLYLIGLDFDLCVDDADGKPVVSDEVQNILTTLGSPYYEISPSGTGIRAFVTYPKPLKGRNKDQREMYSGGRFFTVTGRGSGDIIEAPQALEKLASEWFDKPKRPRESQIKRVGGNFFGNAGTGFELPEVIPEGERNNAMLAFVGSLRGKGIPESVLTLAVRQTNQERFKPPLDDDELQDLIDRYADQAIPQVDGFAVSSEDWPEPTPVKPGLPSVPSFDLNLLPDAFRPFVKDAAERMQCPADFIAAPLVVASAAALGNIVTIAPKAQDTGWLVPATLWGAIVARPGMMKSPAISIALRPLLALEKEMREELQSKHSAYEFEKLTYAADKNKIETKLKKGVPVRPDEMPLEPEKPKPERLITNDSTTQKLGILCASSPRGILVCRDELTGWMESLAAEGREPDRAFYLEGWNGLNSFQVDRVGRESDYIKTLNILMFGGIQQGKLDSHIRAATRGGAGDDGLLQRFQLTVWPDHSKNWVNHDRPPDVEAERAVQDVFRRLRQIDPVAIGANQPSESGGPAWLHFTDEAQGLCDKWRAKLETALRTGDLHPAMESHLAKYRSLIPALALLFHLVDGGTGPVSLGALQRAIEWHNYLWAHARRIYSSVKNSGELAAKSLSNKIRAGKVQDGFVVRDIYRNGWVNLANREDAAEALEILTERGWLKSYQKETTGRSATAYRINPKINMRGG